jgi:hypothetical protein
MTERVLGEKGSKKRKRFLLLPVLVTTAIALLWVAGAQAVHDENFQLDGDVLASTQTHIPLPADTQALDWDSLFTSAGANKDPLPSGFDAASFKKDFNNSGTTFLTNDATTYATGSKDTLPIADWQCNLDNNVNSKIDVMNAYAASYTATDGDEILYFALERNVNTGDANVGFWFLQGPVGCSSSGAAADFTGGHQDGDLLVVSEFSGGGDVSTINAYRWDGNDATGSLNPVPVASGADCRGDNVDPDDATCGAANTDSISTPWLTAAKTTIGNTLPEAQFFEGGVNLTDSNLGGKCFNSFIGDTRSSTSLTATLFDFAGGQLGACESGVQTTPQEGDGDPIPAGGLSIGTGSVTVRDHAELTVSGASAFGGNITFSLCGPLALASTSNCQTGGVQIGSPVAVSGPSPATANSAVATLTSVGRYCWRAVYSGDAGAGVPGSSDPDDATNTSECFLVNPVTPTLTTQASGDVTLGSPISDTATLSGTANQPGTGGLGGAETISPGSINPTTPGAAAGGTISWTAYGPGDCSTVAFGPTTRDVSGNGTYPTAAQTAISFTPTAVGTYTFVASYSGSSPNTNSVPNSACPDLTGAEDVVVSGQASLQTQQRWLPNDSAQITSPSGTTLAGDVTFTLYNDGSCGVGGGTVQYTSGVIDVTTGSGSANSRNVSTNNSTFHVTANNDGSSWSWKVSYDDDNLLDPTDRCETTTPAFTLTD